VFPRFLCCKTKTETAHHFGVERFQKDNSLEPGFSKPAAAEKKSRILYIENEAQQKPTPDDGQATRIKRPYDPSRSERRTQAEATSNRGGGIGRVRVRFLVCGRMKRPLELVLRNRVESPESWMRLRSVAPARGFLCAEG
jgi:hypothetical protein